MCQDDNLPELPSSMTTNAGDSCVVCPNKIVTVFFHGGPASNPELHRTEENNTFRLFEGFRQQATAYPEWCFFGTVAKPGFRRHTESAGVSLAETYILNHYDPENGDDKIFIFGYSWGAESAISLSSELNDAGIPVEALVIVDASDGPLRHSTISDSIPPNVLETLNVYQDSYSGTSSSSRSARYGSSASTSSSDTSSGSSSGSSDSSSGSSSGSSGSSGSSSGSSDSSLYSDGGSSNSPGSRGATFTGNNVTNQIVYSGARRNGEIVDATHGNLPEIARYIVWNFLEKKLSEL